MLRNTYILHIDEPRSKAYLEDCLKSCRKFQNINAIPVEGYNGVSYKDICEEYGIDIIRFYVDQMAENGNVLNKAFSCSAGHFKIWNMIAESGEPGVVLEHDAIVKGDFTNLEVDDKQLLWLGPRIEREDDYTYPTGDETSYVSVSRWEGTHAYAVSPAMARYLLGQIKTYGLNDSIDGQLGMRNMFDLDMVAADPPPVVAVIGNRESCIENSGNPGFWNAHHTPRFLANVRKGANMAPERKLLIANDRFRDSRKELYNVLSVEDKLKTGAKSVLVIGDRYGEASLWLSNILLQHEDSSLMCVTNFRGQEETIFKYNTYFSKYYYKIGTVSVSDDDPVLADATKDDDIKYDVIYICGGNSLKDVIYNCTVGFNLLAENGVMIVADYDQPIVKDAATLFKLGSASSATPGNVMIDFRN